MKRCIVLILACASLLLFSCSTPQWHNEKISHGWIAMYYSLGNNYDSSNNGTAVVIETGSLAVSISADTRNGIYASALDDDDSKYYALCEKYGDINIKGFMLRRAVRNGTRALYVDKWLAQSAIAEQIDNIEVTADICWDSEHPEGAILNDIFELGYSTYYPFVQSGWSLDEPLVSVTKPLEELKAGEMKLLTSFGIHTTKLPEQETDSYVLIVKLYFETGETSIYKFAMSNTPSIRYNSNTCKL